MHESGTTPNRLYVLDGLHRGASIDLLSGRYRLGAPDAENASADAVEAITLHDWQGESQLLTVADNGISVGTDGAEALPWRAGTERTLGGIALRLSERVGDAEAANATTDAAADADTSAAGTTVDRAPARAPRTSLLACGGLCLGLLVAASLLSAGVSAGTGEPPEQAGDERKVTAFELKQRLHGRGLFELEASDVKGRQRVTGVVADAREDAVARSVLHTLPEPRPQAAWAVANEVAAAIESALRVPELEVRYLGGGRFIVEGRAPSPERIEVVAVQLRSDLGDNLRGLQIDVASSRRARTYTAMMVVDGLYYDERSDGTKRFGVPMP